MKREYKSLLNDLIASPKKRTASLDQCLAAARKARRSRQHTRLSLLLIAPLLFAGYIVRFTDRGTVPAQIAHGVHAPRIIPGTDIEVIDDQQLLSLFHDRPAAIIGDQPNQRFLLLDEVVN